MANRTAPALTLRAGDWVELERRVRSGTVAAAMAQRAPIALLAADEVANQAIRRQWAVAPDGESVACQILGQGAEGVGGRASSGSASSG